MQPIGVFCLHAPARGSVWKLRFCFRQLGSSRFAFFSWSVHLVSLKSTQGVKLFENTLSCLGFVVVSVSISSCSVL